MASRVLALLAAVAMVVGAIAVRDQIDDRDQRRTTSMRLVCSTELAEVCADLAAQPGSRIAATVEAAATTAQRLSAPASGQGAVPDGWLVAGPWPAMVADARERSGLEPIMSSGPVLARSPIVMAVWPERAGVLAPRCGAGAPGWKCLGEVAGKAWSSLGGEATWGRVKPGHPEATTAVGLAVLGIATAAYFGRPDLSRDDLEDEGYRGWLSGLQRSVPSRPPSPLVAMLQRGPSAFDAVGTVEAEAGPLLARTARPDKPDLLYPSPVATADVVLGTTGGPAGDLLSRLVYGAGARRLLAARGWRVPGEPAARGVASNPALPPQSGLPSPGLLAALREVVDEAGR